MLAEPVRMTAGAPLLGPDMRFVLLSLVGARPGSLIDYKHQIGAKCHVSKLYLFNVGIQ